MAYLLDVNVVIALIDGNHLYHARATDWFVESAQHDWITCPTVQNGVIRIMSGTHYGPTSFTPAAVADRLQFLMDETVSRFIADDVSLLDERRIGRSALTRSNQITDAYLLALAVANSAMLATMDHRLSPAMVVDGVDYLHLIS